MRDKTWITKPEKWCEIIFEKYSNTNQTIFEKILYFLLKFILHFPDHVSQSVLNLSSFFSLSCKWMQALQMKTFLLQKHFYHLVVFKKFYFCFSFVYKTPFLMKKLHLIVGKDQSVQFIIRRKYPACKKSPRLIRCFSSFRIMSMICTKWCEWNSPCVQSLMCSFKAYDLTT